MIALPWRCGLRTSEVLALAPKDVDAGQGWWSCSVGKAGSGGWLGIDAGTVALVERWVVVRAKLAVPRSAPLICTLPGGAVDSSYVRWFLVRPT
jgi:integrase